MKREVSFRHCRVGEEQLESNDNRDDDKSTWVGSGEEGKRLVQAVVGGFFGDDHVVGVGFS
jgi:hypothetical protein